MNSSIPSEWQLSRRWPDPDTGEFVVDVELGKVPDELGVGWHLDAVRVCLSSQTRAVTTTVLRRVPVWTLVREVIETRQRCEAQGAINSVPTLRMPVEHILWLRETSAIQPPLEPFSLVLSVRNRRHVHQL